MFETSTKNHKTCSSNMIERHQDYSERRQGSLLLHLSKDNFQLQNSFRGTSYSVIANLTVEITP
jgi:hypothetical protein